MFKTMLSLVENFEKRGFSPEKLFLFLGLVFGLIWVILVPPFEAPDDPRHYIRAYMVSEGRVLVKNNDDKKAMGEDFPVEILQMYDATGADQVKFHPNEKQSLDKLKAAFAVKASSGQKVFLDISNTGLYSPLVYAGPAAGIFLGRILDLPLLYGYYLGRLGNLIVLLLLGYWAIRFTPVLKWTMFVFCLMPILFNEAASNSSDVTVIGISLLFIAYVFYLAFDEKVKCIDRKHFYGMIGFMIALGLAKSAYVPLCVLYFLIPVQKFSSGKRFFSYGVGLICLAGITSALWGLTFRGVHVPFPEGIEPINQLQQILLHPLHFLKLVALTTGPLSKRVFNMGWLDTPLPLCVGFVYTIAAFLPCLGKLEMTESERTWRGVFMLVVVFLMYVEVHAALYMSWMQPFGDQVNGVQGRYFLPFGILFFSGMYFLNIRELFSQMKKHLTFTYFLIFMFMLLIATHTIFSRYY